MSQVEALEQAILARAERLANEYRERAKRSRDGILRDAAEKLRLREQREEAIAKSLGDRTYRQQVQAHELNMQSQLDLVRWNLVSDVEARLADAMQDHAKDQTAYLKSLTGLIRTAAEQIEQDGMQVQVNARDLKLLQEHWADVSAALPAGKQVSLADEPIEITAGVLVLSENGRIRVDNSFEGRMARLRAQIQQAILERLLPSGFETGSIFG